MYNPYFANSQMEPYSGDTTYTREEPKVVKVVQPVIKYVYVDKKEVGHKPNYPAKSYDDVEYLEPEYLKPMYKEQKHRRKRSVLLPNKSKYSLRAMNTPRNPSYWPSNPGWYLSPHYYYSKAAYQNSQRQKFWNRKINFHVDELEAPPQPKPMYGGYGGNGAQQGYGATAPHVGYGTAQQGYGATGYNSAPAMGHSASYSAPMGSSATYIPAMGHSATYSAPMGYSAPYAPPMGHSYGHDEEDKGLELPGGGNDNDVNNGNY